MNSPWDRFRPQEDWELEVYYGGPMPEQEEPTLETLKDFGYAPGKYMNTCSDCKNTMFNVAKRCRVCVECAEERYRKHYAE